MNRTASTLVTVGTVGALALAACAPGGGSSGSSSSSDKPASSVTTDAAKLGDVTLTVWDQEVRGGQEKQMSTLIKQFQELDIADARLVRFVGRLAHTP